MVRKHARVTNQILQNNTDIIILIVQFRDLNMEIFINLSTKSNFKIISKNIYCSILNFFLFFFLDGEY